MNERTHGWAAGEHKYPRAQTCRQHPEWKRGMFYVNNPLCIANPRCNGAWRPMLVQFLTQQILSCILSPLPLASSPFQIHCCFHSRWNCSYCVWIQTHVNTQLHSPGWGLVRPRSTSLTKRCSRHPCVEPPAPLTQAPGTSGAPGVPPGRSSL